MSAVQPVRPGTAENLARLSHFRGLDLPEVEELDAVAYFLLGDVGGAVAQRDLWNELREHDCAQLWYLIADDWDDRDLDELSEAQCLRLSLTATEAQVVDARYENTRDRLVGDIERTVWVARCRGAELDATVRRHPAGSGLPGSLSGPGHPMGDYLRMKGER